MGGKAIKGAKRMNVEQYDSIKLHVEKLMKKTLSGVEFRFPVEIGDKDSFGDVDVILLADNDVVRHEIMLMIEHTFNDFVESGDVVSVNYMGYQVDFILVEDSLDFAAEYFSHGDIGNLLGYYAMHLGYKLGRNGLYRSENIPNVGKKRHIITNDWRTALNILGFEAVEYPDSFPHVYGMLNFISQSRLYEIKDDVFNWESLSSRYRSTVRKRPAQRLFFTEYLGYSNEVIDMVRDQKAERKLARMKKRANRDAVVSQQTE